MTSYFAELALLPDGLADNVRFDVADGRFTAVIPNSEATGVRRLPGIVLPGFANCHSHAFHRALRGRTHDEGGTFWTWRERMYALAAGLDPDRYLALARATYAEMALAGATAVGEFHYLHHAPGGRPYADPNAMGDALRAAAAEAGIRLTLFDTCYLAGGLDANGHLPPDARQLRFSDATVSAWAERATARRGDANTCLGVAIHSVRAVPRDALPTVGAAAAADGAPLHVHVSEQVAENEACLEHYGMSPTALLEDAGVLGPATTAVHATHVTAADVQSLAERAATVCLCPTTERDLADGIGPARQFFDAAVPISLGSDQHAVMDLFEEARGVELHERLQSQQRGRFLPAELLGMLTAHDSIGWPDAGQLVAGRRADLVAVRLDSVRTAGSGPDQVIYAAGAPDVDTVLVDGRIVVQDGQHVLGDVGALLATAIEDAWRSR
ncbi:MAG: formimidoylglutamate deiminase [Jatrophihabitans sp.]|uniref:formimidoylglutamate deiminase n=1 Tax=Jatrophihabitans sp. TaxID=1932789 RepID=UPI003912DCCF